MLQLHLFHWIHTLRHIILPCIMIYQSKLEGTYLEYLMTFFVIIQRMKSNWKRNEFITQGWYFLLFHKGLWWTQLTSFHFFMQLQSFMNLQKVFYSCKDLWGPWRIWNSRLTLSHQHIVSVILKYRFFLVS